MIYMLLGIAYNFPDIDKKIYPRYQNPFKLFMIQSITVWMTIFLLKQLKKLQSQKIP